MNPFSQLTPGDHLDGLPSEPWNKFLDVVKPDAEPARREGFSTSPVEILVHNTTAATVPYFGVLGISDPFTTYAADAGTFLKRDVMKGIAPTAGGPFVVVQVGLGAGEAGRARLLGLTRVKLDVQAAGDTFAGPSTSTLQLKTGTSGPARILWPRPPLTPGPGQWGVVELLGQAAAGGSPFVRFRLAAALATTDASQAACPVEDFWGGPDPGGTLTLYNLPASVGYIYSGPANAKGLATFDEIDSKWWIVQLECSGGGGGGGGTGFTGTIGN